MILARYYRFAVDYVFIALNSIESGNHDRKELFAEALWPVADVLLFGMTVGWV